MDKERRVVVFAHLEHKNTKDNKIFVARIRALGLTAYGDSREKAMHQLRKLFSTYVDLHRKEGTLVQRLYETNVRWCYEEDYDGNEPVLMLSPDGEERFIHPKNSVKEDCWHSESRIALAR